MRIADQNALQNRICFYTSVLVAKCTTFVFSSCPVLHNSQEVEGVTYKGTVAVHGPEKNQSADLEPVGEHRVKLTPTDSLTTLRQGLRFSYSNHGRSLTNYVLNLPGCAHPKHTD